MASKLSESVHVMVDNRLSGGTLLEAGAKKCPHCRRLLYIAPLQLQDRHWCAKCDAYTCNNPVCIAVCEPFDKIIDGFLEAGAKQLPFVLPVNK